MNALSTLDHSLAGVIPALPASRPRWALTQEAFDRLLASLGGDRESAGEHYLETRAKLVRFFEWRGCPFPEDHADETINRVARKLVKGEKILNPAGYYFGVARLIVLEINKDCIRQQQALSELPDSTITSNQSDESELRIDRLRQCLQKLSPDDRELILEYYHGEKSVKIDCRKKLAERFGVPMNTLRMRVLRIRENLQRCFENCQTQCKSNCTNRSLVDPSRRGQTRTGFARNSLRGTSLPLLRATVLVVIFACAVSLIGTVPSVAQSANADEMDRSIKPGDDFYRYANGGWLKTVAMHAGQSSYDNRATLTEKTNQRVRDLIQDAAASHPARGSVAQKVGDYYASFMDQDGIEAKGLTPLTDEMALISRITNKESLSAYLGTTLNSEVDGLTANADHIFGLWVNQGFEDSKHNLPHLLQGGLGMPDRDSYLDPSPKMAALRVQYQAHIAAILKLAGVADPETSAARILALEIEIARSHAPDADAADVFKQNNPWKRADFGDKAPGMDWDAYFRGAGLVGQSDFIVWQPTAVIGSSALVDREGIDAWKDYLRFHLIEHYASALPRTVAAEDFAFYGTILSGAQKAPDRNKVAIDATNAALGQAVGQLYTSQYFPPAAKARAKAMVNDLITAYRARISNLTWMSPATRKKALAKLAALTIGVGYPDKWIDYTTLDVAPDDALGNMRRAGAFNRLRNLAQLKQPADPSEWRIDAQIVGAVIMFTPNSEFFAAGILQPPYFDGNGDAASNYGSAGAGIAHEISHSFDELGNIYDDQGRLGNWWTADDLAGYHAAGAKMVTQFDSYCPLSDLCVNGKQVLSENIADLAGMQVAHDAYILSLKGKTDVVTGGLSGEQRFFVAFAQRWRRLQSESALRRQIKTDIHAPGEYRSDTVRNVDAWYKAFQVVPADKLYLKPEDRVGIW